MKRKIFKKFALIIIIYYVVILISGCSSEKEVKKETETKISRPKKIVNIESEERLYIKKNNIN